MLPHRPGHIQICYEGRDEYLGGSEFNSETPEDLEKSRAAESKRKMRRTIGWAAILGVIAAVLVLIVL